MSTIDNVIQEMLSEEVIYSNPEYREALNFISTLINVKINVKTITPNSTIIVTYDIDKISYENMKYCHQKLQNMFPDNKVLGIFDSEQIKIEEENKHEN